MKSSKIIRFGLGNGRLINNLQPICSPYRGGGLWCINTKSTGKHKCVYNTVITSYYIQSFIKLTRGVGISSENRGRKKQVDIDFGHVIYINRYILHV